MGKRNKIPGLYRRGKKGTFYIQKQISVGGRVVTLSESTGTTTPEEAERYYHHRLAQVRDQHIYGIAPKMTLLQAADRMLDESQHLRSVSRYETAWRAIVPELGHLTLDQVHNGTVQPYIKRRMEQDGISAGTANHEIATISRAMNLAARVWRDEAGNPYLTGAVPLLQRVSGTKRRPYPLNRDEQKRLLSELPDYLRVVTEFALNTGCRAQEILNLQWDWLVHVPELGSEVFCLPAELAKNGQERVIILNSAAQRIVREQRGKHPKLVFTRDGVQIRRTVDTAWNSATRRAGLQVRFHDTRHTLGYMLRSVGCPEADIASILGHKAGSITLHYSAASLRSLREWLERIVEAAPSTAISKTFHKNVVALRNPDRFAVVSSAPRMVQ